MLLLSGEVESISSRNSYWLLVIAPAAKPSARTPTMAANKSLVLEAGFDENSYELNKIPTNYFREIAYNLEHAIHHMALIKIGIQEVSAIQLPDGYGVASSTLKYRKEAELK
jgi:hypothetical protein